MPTSYADLAIVATIVVIGVLTYAVRLSFIAALGNREEMPARLERALRHVPAAVLAALVLPAFVEVQPDAGGIAVDRVVAGGIAAGVAWRTEDVLATMVAGMGALWTVRFLL